MQSSYMDSQIRSAVIRSEVPRNSSQRMLPLYHYWPVLISLLDTGIFDCLRIRYRVWIPNANRSRRILRKIKSFLGCKRVIPGQLAQTLCGGPGDIAKLDPEAPVRSSHFTWRTPYPLGGVEELTYMHLRSLAKSSGAHLAPRTSEPKGRIEELNLRISTSGSSL